MKTKSSLKSGDKIKVYQKPLTEEQYQGVAVLHSRIDSYTDSKGNECWNVVFNYESYDVDIRIVRRIVNLRNKL